MGISKIVVGDLNFYVPILTVKSVDHAMTHGVATMSKESEPQILRVFVAPIGGIDQVVQGQRERMGLTLEHRGDIGIVLESKGALIIKSHSIQGIPADIALDVLQKISERVFNRNFRFHNPATKSLNWQHVGTVAPPDNALQLHKRQ